jgi:phosphopantothenoylcysteine synthetase/decarboxylase
MNGLNENASKPPAVFVFITGAGSCLQVPPLVQRLVADGLEVHCVLTPNVAQVTEPVGFMDIPGSHWIADYGQPPLDTYPYGLQVVVPCTFNTLNKLAAGIADNLATAMLGDALGAGCPMLIAPGMNRGQRANPRVSSSIELLTEWGCEFVPPQERDGRLTVASMDTVYAAIRPRLKW